MNLASDRAGYQSGDAENNCGIAHPDDDSRSNEPLTKPIHEMVRCSLRT